MFKIRVIYTQNPPLPNYFTTFYYYLCSSVHLHLLFWVVVMPHNEVLLRISSQLCTLWCHVANLKMAMMRVLTSQIATKKDSCFLHRSSCQTLTNGQRDPSVWVRRPSANAETVNQRCRQLSGPQREWGWGNWVFHTLFLLLMLK